MKPRPPRFRLRRSKLVLVVLLAGLMLLAANLAADFLGLKYLHPGNKRWYLSAWAEQWANEPIDLLVLGSSKARFGINVTRVSAALAEEGVGDLGAFNLAQPAAGSVRNAALLRDLIERRGCPSVIVLEVSPLGLHPEGIWWRLLGDYATLRDLAVLAPDLGTLEHADGYLSASTRGFERFYDYLARRPDSDDVERELSRRGSQYNARPRSFPRLERDLELAPPTEPPGQRGAGRQLFELRASPARALEELTDSARRCSARLVLLSMPTATALSRTATTHREEQLRSELGAFARRNEISFLDYNLVDLGLESANFRDWTHLNYEGAELLSDHLARQVLSPLIRADRGEDAP
jgi:hypothetical protein